MLSPTHLQTEIDAEDQKALHQELLHLNKNRSGFDEKDIMDHVCDVIDDPTDNPFEPQLVHSTIRISVSM